MSLDAIFVAFGLTGRVAEMAKEEIQAATYAAVELGVDELERSRRQTAEAVEAQLARLGTMLDRQERGGDRLRDLLDEMAGKLNAISRDSLVPGYQFTNGLDGWLEVITIEELTKLRNELADLRAKLARRQHSKKSARTRRR